MSKEGIYTRGMIYMSNVLRKLEISWVLGDDNVNGKVLKGSQRISKIYNNTTADDLATVGNGIKVVIGY